MPSKFYSRNFEPGYHYHIYNRGGFKHDIFLDDQDYQTFLEIVEYYLKSPTGQPRSVLVRHTKPIDAEVTNKVPNLVSFTKSSFQIISFCLMPNHFHFLVKQTGTPSSTNSISNFMRRLCITYAMYFIDKYNHSGNLLQGKYKNILVDTEEYLLYLTKYIHLNPRVADPLTYPYSSCVHYLGLVDIPWVSSKDILEYFSKTNNHSSYKSFIKSGKPDSELPKKLFLE